MKKEYILGIESTAHTFGIGIVKNGKVLANVKSSYTTESGGIIPTDSAKHHEAIKNEVYEKALKEAKISEKDIKAIAFSQAPGLAPCLLVGLRFAKHLSKTLGIPLVPVNHCVAHLEIGEVTGAKNPVLLYCSGANTQIISYSAGKYRIFGETLDVGIGNFIDTFARYSGLGFPGGPKIAKLAEEYRNNSQKKPEYIDLPYSIKGMDVAFSGLLTNLKQKLESSKLLNKYGNFDSAQKSKKTGKISDTSKYSLEQLSYSMEETAFAMLIEAAERALAHLGKKELLLGGGVACNKRLQEMCKIMCKERKAKLFVPENSLLVDQGAMIAYLGEILFNNSEFVRVKDLDRLDIKPRQRTDDVLIKYKKD